MGWGVPEAGQQCYNSPMNSDLSERTRTTRAKMPFLGRTLGRGPTKTLSHPEQLFHEILHLRKAQAGSLAFPLFQYLRGQGQLKDHSVIEMVTNITKHNCYPRPQLTFSTSPSPTWISPFQFPPVSHRATLPLRASCWWCWCWWCRQKILTSSPKVTQTL